MLFTEKYRPKTFDEIVPPDGLKDKFQKWKEEKVRILNSVINIYFSLSFLTSRPVIQKIIKSGKLDNYRG